MDNIETPYEEEAEFIQCTVSLADVSLHVHNEVGDCKVQYRGAAWLSQVLEGLHGVTSSLGTSSYT